MRLTCLIVGGIVLCTLALSAAPDNTASLIEQLRAALREERSSAKATAKDDQERSFGASVLTEVKGMIMRGDSQVQIYLNELAGETKSEKVRGLAKQLAASVRDDQEKRDAAFVEESEKCINSAAEVILKAKTAKELDPVLKSLADLRDRRGQSSSEIDRRAQSRVEAALHFTSRWQDYLQNLATHNQKAARDNMRSLADSGSQLSIVPRSEILARAQGLSEADGGSPEAAAAKRADEIMAKVKTLDDIEPALRELRSLRADNQSIDGGLLGGLTALQRSYLENRAGLSSSLSLPAIESHPALIPLKAQLLLVILPKSLGLSAPPKGDETPAAYLQRIAQEAKQAKDWPLYVKATQALRTIALPPGGGFAQDNFSSFVAALNQEKAGLYAAAFQSYEQALRTGGADIPAEFIGERLAALQRDHQTEIDERENASRARAAAMRANAPPGVDPRSDPRRLPPEVRQTPSPTSPPAREITIPVPTPGPEKK